MFFFIIWIRQTVRLAIHIIKFIKKIMITERHVMFKKKLLSYFKKTISNI